MANSKNTVDIKELSYTPPKSKDGAIFNDFSISFKKNQIITILGPSGCGKSTLANLMAGYLKPSAGVIKYFGKVYAKPGKHCIVINQSVDIFEWLTVYDNLCLVSDNKFRIEKYIELVGLKGHEQVRGYALSGGMKKRLSFARALLVNPTFLIMDEAFSSLDYVMRHRLYEEFLAITRAEKKTTLLITHDIEEALYLSDRILIISGRPITIREDLNLTDFKKNTQDPHAHDLKFYQTMERIKQVLTEGS